MTTKNVYRFLWGQKDDAQVWVVHCGSKSTPLIAQLFREIGLQSRVLNIEDFSDAWSASEAHPRLVVLSGGDQSVYAPNAPRMDEALYFHLRQQGVAVLGICYGAQMVAELEDGKVAHAAFPEYGIVRTIRVDADWPYHGGRVVMNHGDEVITLPDGWKCVASTERCANALFQSPDGRVVGIQFHPEMDHTEHGDLLLRHVACTIAGCEKDFAFDPAAFVDACVPWMRDACGGRSTACGLSGGVDSAVAFAIAERAGLTHLRGIFVDTGWMRKGEKEEVRGWFGDERVQYVDAASSFHDAIEAIPYPDVGSVTAREGIYYEQVRAVIGGLFYRVFHGQVRQYLETTGDIVLLQGTNAADLIESLTRLKKHHNLEEPAEDLRMGIVEPLAGLYKTEIRQLATFLGLPMEVAERQPFPGPGLAIRAWGKLTRDYVPPLQDANAILEEVVRKHYPRYKDRPCQYYVALMPLPSTGLMGDDRVIGLAWGVRMVWSDTRETYATLSVQALTQVFQEELGHRLTTETKMPDGTRFVRVYDEITPKPPSTTEPH